MTIFHRLLCLFLLACTVHAFVPPFSRSLSTRSLLKSTNQEPNTERDASRRTFMDVVTTATTVSAAALVSSTSVATPVLASAEETVCHLNDVALPKLKYDYDALQPYISMKTMKVHHDKHHAKYVKTTQDMIKARKIY